MDAPWYIYVLAVFAGALAGIINTLAGSGSTVTLPMLDLLGLPAPVANATNRVGVAVQNIVGITAFASSKRVDTQGSWWYTGPAIIGGLLGAQIAANLSETVMNYAIGTVMVILLFVILYNPKRWLRDKSEVAEGRPGLLMLGLFFAIGVYGGFVQAGVGVFLLSALVMGVGYNLNTANFIKLIIVLAVTIAALIVFLLNDPTLIRWDIGLLMAVGQSIGAWMAARFATQYKDANLWVRRLLIMVVVVAIVRFFGIDALVMGLF